MSKNSRVFALLAVAALAVCAAGSAGSAGASGPAASASKSCSISGQETDFGHNMYLDGLTVRHASCRKGKAVVRGYTACRYNRSGLNGKCPGRIHGFKCHEGNRTIAPHIQYSVHVTCKHGAKRVKFTYTQQV
jgi:hypothetical protein